MPKIGIIRPRFSLLTGSLVISAVCCYLAWQCEKVHERREVKRLLDENGYEIWAGCGVSMLAWHDEVGELSALRRWMGDQHLSQFVKLSERSGVHLERIERAYPETKFFIEVKFDEHDLEDLVEEELATLAQ